MATPNDYRRAPHRNSRGNSSQEGLGDTAKRFKDWFNPVKGSIDYPFLLAVILLMAFGLIMLFSAGNARAYSMYGDILYFLKKQLGGVILGGIAMIVLANFDYPRNKYKHKQETAEH